MATVKKFDAVTPRPKYGGAEGDVWWHRVGNAVQNEKGQISVYLDSVPVPDPKRENKIVIMLFEPREREETQAAAPAQRAQQKPREVGGRKNTDEEIPF